ncbi:hypothetical protein IVB12_08630 [Bradyrhizobium sp. 179]|uniref:hypothetical protein n=1 Tax=Bradyrhizobium sp. 179 TaxID=2782648 RepID=UPI001FF71F4A|nr:hypothetical protein [Bradyrhizobium sp. 179]MCK1542033.1 hypothetical protein [Bradyrhizobium sp. 179]
MSDAGKTVETDKQRSAIRQICAAIKHFQNGEYECAITLAAAGEGQVPESMKSYLFRLLKEKLPGHDHNAFSNWLKHPTGPKTATISELEVVVMIARAIQKFVAAYEATRPEFEAFSNWAVNAGHIPRPLTEKA